MCMRSEMKRKELEKQVILPSAVFLEGDLSEKA